MKVLMSLLVAAATATVGPVAAYNTISRGSNSMAPTVSSLGGGGSGDNGGDDNGDALEPREDPPVRINEPDSSSRDANPATSRRARYSQRCLTQYAPADLELSAEPDAEDADFCREAEASGEFVEYLELARQPQPSAEETWRQILWSEGGGTGPEGYHPGRSGGGSPPLLAFVETASQAAAAIPGKASQRWLSTDIPYCFLNSLPKAAETRFNWAKLHLEKGTCIRFLPLSSCADAASKGIKNFIRLGDDKSELCHSSVGMQGGSQDIQVASWCSAGSLVHETMHALGFHHMQARLDRDTYIKIWTSRIQSGKGHNFAKQKASDGFKDYGNFDFGSIMMYGGTAFQKPGETRPTITAVAPHVWNGVSQRAAATAADKKSIASMYKCPSSAAISHGGHNGDETGNSHASKPNALFGKAGEDAWFKALVKGIDSSATHKSSALFGVLWRVHEVQVKGATPLWFEYEKKDGDYMWRWSADKSNWNNVPSFVQSGGKYDGFSPAATNVKIIEELATRTGRQPASNTLALLKEWSKSYLGETAGKITSLAGGVVAVKSAGTSDGCTKTRYFKQVGGFWYSSDSEKGAFSRVATAWAGKWCQCHNALAAQMLVHAGGKTGAAPAGKFLRATKCFYQSNKHQFWVRGAGSCERKTTGSCGKNADCRPKADVGCRGRCICGYDGVNECQCMRPVDRNTISCQSREQAFL